jgi:tryptophan-rich sensory protein
VRTDGWYAALNKPAWTPPNALFGPAWTTIYLLTGFAGWLAWTRGSAAARRPAFIAYALHLLFNGLWTPLFFGLHRPGAALLCLSLLWGTLFGSIRLFYRRSPAAAWLLVPGWVWVSFAGALNFAIWRLN